MGLGKQLQCLGWVSGPPGIRSAGRRCGLLDALEALLLAMSWSASCEMCVVRFASLSATAGHLAAYAGLAPATRSSGSSIRSAQPSRRGNKQLERAFFLSAFAALGDPQSFDLRVGEENDSIGLGIEAEHRTAIVAFRVHQHRLTQPPPDLPEEVAERVKSLLALQFPQVDVEVDFIVGIETEDRQDIVNRPDPQIRTFGIRRAGQHGLRPGHRKLRLSLEVPALPAPLRDKIEDRLPVLHRGIRDTHVRQRPHQVRVEEGTHVIPQQISHPAMLPGSPTQRTPFPLTKGVGAPEQSARA